MMGENYFQLQQKVYIQFDSKNAFSIPNAFPVPILNVTNNSCKKANVD
jgi:hypothetical protein